MTKDMGAGGAQVLVGKISKLDAQGMTAWFNNILVSVMANEAEQDTIGFMVYATTDNTWDDDNIISARAGAVGKTVNLPVKRRISKDGEAVTGNDGVVYIWLEFSDTVFSEDARIVFETWGRFIEFDEQ